MPLVSEKRTDRILRRGARLHRISRKMGGRIRKARVSSGMSQQQLADEVGTTQMRISQIEIGDGSLSMSIFRLLEIADALNIEPVLLLGENRL